MDDSAGEWLSYEEAGQRLHVSPAAVRARALRGGWRRQPGNDGKARVWITPEVVHAAAQHPREQPGKARIAGLVTELREHVSTLRGHVARLEGELARAQAIADRSTADLVELARKMAEIAENQAARELEPPMPKASCLRRSAAGRAWRWFVRN
jgi:hypothetical protein